MPLARNCSTAQGLNTAVFPAHLQLTQEVRTRVVQKPQLVLQLVCRFALEEESGAEGGVGCSRSTLQLVSWGGVTKRRRNAEKQQQRLQPEQVMGQEERQKKWEAEASVLGSR